MITRYLIIISIVLTVISCNTKQADVSGLYVSKNNDLFYALRVSDAEDSIELYMLKEYSSQNDDSLKVEKRKDFSIYKKGVIKIENDLVRIVMIETDNFLGNHFDFPSFLLKENELQINCEALTKIYFSLNPQIGCREENIVFVKK